MPHKIELFPGHICIDIFFLDLSALEVYCNLTWLQVNLRALTFGDWYVLSDEVFLGHGCPVSTVFQDMYVFWYPTSDCGIQSQVRATTVILD